MKVIIIGAVAGGTSAAAKLSRLNKDVEITMYDALGYISYSSCNMPYYIGDIVEDEDSLVPRDPEYFAEHYGVCVKTRHRVESINAEKKTLIVRNLETDETFEDTYDKLIFATGARSAFPPIEGLDQDHVYSVRVVEDMKTLKEKLSCCTPAPATAIVIGSGFIGLEMVENFHHLGHRVKLLVMSHVSNLSPEMSIYMEEQMKRYGVEIIQDAAAKRITPDGVETTDGRFIEGDFVFVATGAKPNTELAASIGVSIGKSGAIITNPFGETNIPDIYAAGDCAETVSVVDHSPVYIPLGSTANKMGRTVADAIAGICRPFPGIAGTSIFKLFDMEIGSTGLSEKRAKELGYSTLVFSHANRSHYASHGGEPILVKAVADRRSLRLLGVEVIGFSGVKARLDTYATYITFGGTLDKLEYLDLAYAPPFATVRDVVLYTGMVGMSRYEKGKWEMEKTPNADFLKHVKTRPLKEEKKRA